MKTCISIVFIVTSYNLAFCQNFELCWGQVDKATGHKLLFAVDSISNTQDILIEVASYYEIYDSLIHPPDSISIIFTDEFGFFFTQLIKNQLTDDWQLNLTASWAESNVEHVGARINAEETFKLVDLNTIVKVQKNEQRQFNLQYKKWAQ